jgi:hypothetical protein
MKKSCVIICIVSFFASACGPVVLDPPMIDLFSMERIGLISFGLEKAQGKLDSIATQRFLQEVQWAQRGVQVVELGTREDVLADLGLDRLGPDAAKAIGDKYGVAAFFTGNVMVSDVRPEIDLATIIKTLSVRASFTIEISARLIDTDSGATLWTDSVSDDRSVAKLTIMEGRIPWFDLRSQEKVYRKMMDRLVTAITRDFRPTRRRLAP